ncbi:uncharacterized protein LOC133724291 [Rosa rugosa]|uniref:uncharacterized protein LOC133724291 n=1 Tax=Rosa rugosa TaxID=74645 RepID=UPI002B40F905|nr:uncharacterized protein LOC133724291 [Rosa rugosa]
MDKSWMHADRRSLKFKIGLEDFLKFALANARDISKICCPCLKCCNNDEFSVGVIKDHIYFNGIDVRYKQWKWHGEPSAMNADILGESETVDMGADFGIGDEDDEISSDSNEFLRFVEDGDKPLYPGCTKTTKLNGLIQTFNLKAKHGMTDSCYSDMLIMIGMLLPEGNEVPGSVYEAKKTLAALGMGYERIHACPNDCILYRGQHAEATSCPTCGESRWKLGRDNTNKEGVPGKVLWYFPPIPRFKRMFQSTKTAKDLTWHANDRKTDGMMRHPADSPTWKLVDTKWPEFGSEPRNLRLALSSDGFNPHSSLSSRYSCWPVILVTYNLPPWLCMKRKHMMLTLLISGPKQPGNDIDVYLQPLIDDLKLLWVGVEVYDALRGESFKLKAVLFWTINDFPAYGNLSGSITKGYNACPVCVDETRPYRLKHSNKMAFMRHRRFLPRHHPYRRQAAAFDNTIEKDVAPSPLSGEEMLSRVEGLNIPFGKKKPCPPHKGVEAKNRPCWKKKSVFFELDYWKHLPVRHILDVMHIEKNCCDAILGTVLNIPGKTKDGAASRLDMVDMGIRTDLKPTPGPKRAKLPLASWNLLLDEKKILCSSFFNMTVPVRFCSNIRNLVSMEDLRLVGLKSHDCHTIMQILLPVALRSVLEKPVRYAIIRFCLFFKAICSKVIDVSKLQQMQADLIDTVCLLEKFFPPSFFDVMIHLTVHLVREVELCGPVFLRWMYPFERYMKVFKGYVRSRHFPEGCIAENYIVEEAIEFCSERMLRKDDTTVGIPSKSLSGLCNGCKPLSGATMVIVSAKELQLAHLCVLRNTEDAIPYFKEHMELLELTFPKFMKNKRWLREKQNATFGDWLKERVANAMSIPDNDVSETMRWMAGGPRHEVPTFSGYHVSGVDFNTKSRDNVRSVQNSGVFLLADAMQVASAKDRKPRTDDMDFYGVIKTIWEVDYYKFRVPLFKCDWVESSRGVKVDDLGFTLVKLNRIGHLNDPFVLATHVKQVFYIEDPLDAEWSVVVRCPDKDYEGANDECEDPEVDQLAFIPTMPSVETFDDVVGHQPSIHMRDGDEGIWVDN